MRRPSSTACPPATRLQERQIHHQPHRKRQPETVRQGLGLIVSRRWIRVVRRHLIAPAYFGELSVMRLPSALRIGVLIAAICVSVQGQNTQSTDAQIEAKGMPPR